MEIGENHGQKTFHGKSIELAQRAPSCLASLLSSTSLFNFSHRPSRFRRVSRLRKALQELPAGQRTREHLVLPSGDGIDTSTKIDLSGHGPWNSARHFHAASRRIREHVQLLIALSDSALSADSANIPLLHRTASSNVLSPLWLALDYSFATLQTIHDAWSR